MGVRISLASFRHCCSVGTTHTQRQPCDGVPCAASEDRTHDLRIMRPTRCQLRYRRSMHACHSTSMVARSRGCALASRARPWQHTRNVAARGLWPAHACGARSMRIAPTTLVALASEPPGGGRAWQARVCLLRLSSTWGYGATAARVTPDHKVGSSNLSGLIHAISGRACGSLATAPCTCAACGE